MNVTRTVSFLLAGSALSLFFLDSYPLPSTEGGWRLVLKTASFFISPGLNAVLWPALFVVRYMRKKGWFLCYITASIGFSYLATCLGKVVLGRARPALEAGFHPLTFDAHYHSCPSGHATISMALFTSLAHLFPHKAKWLLGLGMTLPLTRLLLGKHFLSDILLGEAIGCAVATLFLGRLSHLIYQLFGKIIGVERHDSR